MSRITLPSGKYAWEVKSFAFDFSSSDLNAPAFSSVTGAIALYSGTTDPTPPTITVTFIGPVAYAIVAGGTQGNIYDISIQAIMSDGQSLQLNAYLTILADYP